MAVTIAIQSQGRQGSGVQWYRLSGGVVELAVSGPVTLDELG